ELELRALHDSPEQREARARAALDDARRVLLDVSAAGPRQQLVALGSIAPLVDTARREARVPPVGLVLGARPLDPSVSTTPPPPIDWISRDLQLGPGRPNMLIGYSGSAKSLFCLALALAVAKGSKILGQFETSRQRRVLILTQDSGRHACEAR